MRAPTISNPGREVARRVSGGIKITLYWNADDNTTNIEIRQPETEETLSFGDGSWDGFRDVEFTPEPRYAGQRRTKRGTRAESR
jgi:hypothetical protein